MERVMIIGCGGSGTRTLARALGKDRGIPVVHLDQIWWSPGNWQHLEREEFDSRLMKIIEEPLWIIDGNFNRTITVRLERADTVIYLDYNRIICLLHWMKRVIQNWGHARDDMAPGCTEWFDPEFASWIWSFNRTHRKEYYELLRNQHGKAVYIFKNPRQTAKFLKNCHFRAAVLEFTGK